MGGCFIAAEPEEPHMASLQVLRMYSFHAFIFNKPLATSEHSSSGPESPCWNLVDRWEVVGGGGVFALIKIPSERQIFHSDSSSDHIVPEKSPSLTRSQPQRKFVSSK